MLMTLSVLPPPFSTSLFPELSGGQRKAYRDALRVRTGCCFWCNRPFGRKTKITIDHVVPTSRGGKHTVDNLVVACRYCNMAKSGSTPEEWVARLETIINQARALFPMLTVEATDED